MRQREYGIHVVLDEDDGVIGCQRPQQGGNALRFFRSHAGERFVE